MKSYLKLLLLSVLIVPTVAVAQTTQKQRLGDHLYYLASDSLRGREAGTDDARKAGDYIAAQFAELGLSPYSDSTNYFQLFSTPSSQRCYRNVVGIIEGNDPQLKNELVIIGAHYDHLGVRGDDIYNGADDNASGTSAIIEMARQLVARRNELKRTVMICGFDAEEMGLYGSNALAKAMQQNGSLERVKVMVSMDMVGWYKSDKRLNIAGYQTIKDGKRLLTSVEKPDTMNVKLEKFETFIFGATDTQPFAQRKVATLAVDTGLKSPYHKPEDTADKIDYDGLDAVTDYMTRATVAMASADELSASGRLADKHRIGASVLQGGITASLGSSVLVFPKESAISSTRGGFAWNAGLFGQVNFGSFGVRVNCLYDSRRAKYPVDFTNVWSGKQIWQTQALTVPVAFVCRVFDDHTAGVSIFAGGYWSYLLGGKVGSVKMNFDNYNRQEWGWTAGFELRVGSFIYGYRGLMSLTDTTTSSPAARYNTHQLVLGYLF